MLGDTRTLTALCCFLIVIFIIGIRSFLELFVLILFFVVLYALMFSRTVIHMTSDFLHSLGNYVDTAKSE